MNDSVTTDPNDANQGSTTTSDQTLPAAGSGRDLTTQGMDALIAEADALALYVSRHGDALARDQHELHGNLLSAIVKVKQERTAGAWQELMAAYAEITAVTYKERGVNGRTVLDTKAAGSSRFWQLSVPRNRPIVIGVTFFFLALLLELLMHWSGGVSDATTLGWMGSVGHLVGTTLSNLLSPALWGGLGACIFLTKRISDKLFELAYEESRMRGDVTRIFLGSMVGVVAVVLIFPDFTERVALGEVSLAPATVAFVAGLGVKPVYAGFEALSEELARRFGGQRQPPQG